MTEKAENKPTLADRIVNTGLSRVAAENLISRLTEPERAELEKKHDDFYSAVQNARQRAAKRTNGERMKTKAAAPKEQSPQ
ncbi:MAG: hypothetical protein R3C03_23940 [Pirellulaceae bacterium]